MPTVNQLIELEEKIYKAPGKDIVISPAINSIEAASCLLRSAYGDSSTAFAISKSAKISSSVGKLELVRNLLDQGDLEKAYDIIQDEIPKSKEIEFKKTMLAEWNCEKVRFLVLSNKYREAIQLADELKSGIEANPVTFMTIHQLLGHSFYALNRYQEAIDALIIVERLSEIFKNAYSAFSTQAFLCLSYLKSQNETMAKLTLKKMETQLDSWNRLSVYPQRFLT